MRNIVLLVIISYCCFADWGSGDSSNLAHINTYVTDIYNVNSSIYNEMYKYKTGYYSNEPAGYAMGWKDYFMQSFKAQRELSEAKEYNFRRVDGRDTIQLMEQNPFSDENKTLFDQNDLAQENQPYYQNYIFSFFPSEYSNTWNNSIPDSSFLNAPASGDIMNKTVTEMNNAGYGIYNIATSQQTSAIRSHVQLAENSLNGMFNSSNYSNAVINWDLSALGQVFVDRHIMHTNPFMNLRGTFRIVPNATDFHYKLWYDYFRDGSTFGNLIRTCATAFVFFLVLVYVINDIMSIVDA